MSLDLIPEEEMSTKHKKVDIKPKLEIKIVQESKDIKIESKKDTMIPENKKQSGVAPGVTPTIVKRVYFPGSSYSKKENQTEFKKILSVHGLSWVRGMMKTYNGAGGPLMTGMYASFDKNKRVFCIYEGTNKPTTAIVKIIGSGGNFLIDLNSFCHKNGIIIEDKDESYADKVMLILKEKRELYVETENKTLEDIRNEIEEKIKKRIEEAVEIFINSHRFIYDSYCESLFWKRGLSEEFVRKFRRMEIKDDVRWAVEHGF